MVSLPGSSPALLSAMRERRVHAARTPWTPTPSSPKSSKQAPPSNTRTSNFAMNPRTLLSKIQTNASTSMKPISEEVKDSGASIVHQFSSGVFSLVVKPVFSSFKKGFSCIVDGHRVSLPQAPTPHHDKQGLLLNIKLEFMIESGSAPQQLRKATLHLHSTTTKLHTQGGGSFYNENDSPTVAQWFVTFFVLPKIEQEVKDKNITSAQVGALHQQILRMKPSAPSTISSMNNLPPSKSQDGLNKAPVFAECALCTRKFDGRTQNILSCDTCSRFFHHKCLKEHTCGASSALSPYPQSDNRAMEESDIEDLDINLSNSNISQSTPRQLPMIQPPPEISRPPSTNLASNTAQVPVAPISSIPVPAPPNLQLGPTAPPSLTSTTITTTRLSTSSVPADASHSRSRSGPALTPGGLELVIQQSPYLGQARARDHYRTTSPDCSVCKGRCKC